VTAVPAHAEDVAGNAEDVAGNYYKLTSY